jgi:hypothetical protein
VVYTQTALAVESHNLTSHFDSFLETVCNIQQLEKEEVLTKAIDSWIKNFSGVMEFSATRFRELYNDNLSGQYSLGTQADAANNQRILVQSLMFGRSPMFLTSDGMIGRLRMTDETLQEGDVLALMKGTSVSFMLRPSSTHAQEGYEFVGACKIFYGSAKITEIDREVQSFRLV